MGAENPFYSMALLDVPSNIPTIIQLQALLTRLVDVTTVNEEKKSFYYKGLIEREIIKKADYIGTLVKDFREYIEKEIKPDARFLDITLAMAQKVNPEPIEKQFDFVYFSSNIAKAGEEAVESFILASKVCPKISLDIVGGYEDTFKAKLDTRIKECGLSDCVVFEGRLPSHDDVIKQIKKAKFALLPLKMDFVPNTIHEAMANGLPVVTTITDGTPSLNQPCLRVLLSPQNDFQAMANNMIALLEDKGLEKELRTAAALYEEERTNNRAIVLNWCKAYQKIVSLCI
jgi:glycosyltransferase involved in cell wall biosynthesis